MVDLTVDRGMSVRFFCGTKAGCDPGQVKVMAAEKHERRVALRGLIFEVIFRVEPRDDITVDLEEPVVC